MALGSEKLYAEKVKFVIVRGLLVQFRVDGERKVKIAPVRSTATVPEARDEILKKARSALESIWDGELEFDEQAWAFDKVNIYDKPKSLLRRQADGG